MTSPGRWPAGGIMKRILQKTLSLFVFFSFTLTAMAQAVGPQFPDPGKTSMSKQQQQQLGSQVAEEVYKTMPVLSDNSPETQYVREVGNKLVATIPQEYSWPFEFHVIPQKEINAFAIPGGQMFINLGTVTAATKESELAGVMAHEMAHVYMQHSAKQAGKAQKTEMLAGILSSVVGAKGGMLGQLGQMGIQMGAQGMMAKYSRGDETQADAVGAVILQKAGYNPQAMVDFFKTLEGSSKVSSNLFSSHPNPGNRQQAIANQIANWPKTKFVENRPAFDKARQSALQTKTYTAQEIEAGAKSGQWATFNQNQRSSGGATTGGGTGGSGGSGGSSSGGVFPTGDEMAGAPAAHVPIESVLPSQKVKSSNLGPISISHPVNWQVTSPKQKGDFVTIAPEAGITGDSIGYGVLLNGIPPPGQKASLDDMTKQLIEQIKQNIGLEPLGVPKRTTVAGSEGRITLMRSDSPFESAQGEPQTERDVLVTVLRADGSLIYMIFVAPETDFARFQPAYEAMLKSVQFR